MSDGDSLGDGIGWAGFWIGLGLMYLGVAAIEVAGIVMGAK